MSTETTSTSDGVFKSDGASSKVVVPPVVATPVAPSVVAPVVTATVVPAVIAEPTDGQEPPWLAARLSRAENAVLRKLGIDPSKTEDAKEALAAYRAKIEKDKTDLDKANEKARLVPDLTKERDDLKATVTGYAVVELAKLAPEQKAAVLAIAGEDPAKQLTTVNALRATWAVVAPVVPIAATTTKVEVAAPVVKVPIPPFANTAPPVGSPGAAAPTPPGDHLGTMRMLEQTNPIKAAAYYAKFQYIINAQVAAETAAKQPA